MTNVKRFLGYMTKYKKQITLSMVFAVISSTIDVLTVYYIGRSTMVMVKKGEVLFDKLLNILIIFLISVVIGVVCQWFLTYFSNKVSNWVIRDMRKETFEKFKKLPISYFDKTSHGEIMSKFTNDLDSVSIAMMLGINSAFSGVIVIIISAVFMLSIDVTSAMVIFLMTPITFIVAFFVAKRSRYTFIKQQQEMGEMTGYLEEFVGNKKLVKVLQYDIESEKTFNILNEEFRKTNTKAQFSSALTNPSARFINNISYILVVLVGAFGALSGRLGFGAISSFLLYSSQFAKPFNEISGISGQVQTAVASLDRVFSFLDEKEEPKEEKNLHVFNNVRGEIRFENVKFSYDKKQPLMSDVSFKADQGEKIAIVGPTGAGKTTLVNLLMRFYDVDSGHIYMDDVDIKKATRDSVRSQFGMVLQDTWLFKGTVAENIAYSRPDAKKEEIIEAAKHAYAHSFIKRLENGYETVLDEDGGNLSVGQKQLLTIARVMLLDPPILILDEATSSIDTLTEKRIQKAINEMMKEKTSFVIAHRLSTITAADTILVLKDGDIIEQGNHEVLLNKGGFYKMLYESQFT